MATGSTRAADLLLDVLDEIEDLQDQVAELREAHRDPWVVLNEAIEQDRACEALWDVHRGRKKAR